VHVTTPPVLAEDDAPPEDFAAETASFVETLVDRLHADYGVDPRAIRSLALQVLATFAGARVQAFVPVMVEKRLREIYRRAARVA
jgi:hypothetical protein